MFETDPEDVDPQRGMYCYGCGEVEKLWPGHEDRTVCPRCRVASVIPAAGPLGEAPDPYLNILREVLCPACAALARAKGPEQCLTCGATTFAVG